MKRVLLILALSLGLCLAFAQTKSTPETTVKMNVNGIQVEFKSNEVIVEDVLKKLNQLDKYFLGLNRAEQKAARDLVAEIIALLKQIPPTASANVNLGRASDASMGSQIQITPDPSVYNDPKPGLHAQSEVQPQKPDQIKPVQPQNPGTTQAKPAPQQPRMEFAKSARKQMADKDFNEFIQAMAKKSFAADKIVVLETATRHAKFNTTQIIRILKEFPHSSNKMEALRIAYPECTDPQNSYKIYDAFTYSTDKEEAQEIIEAN
ncbi:MAG: DUF4476 domain-containing protein [Candidatus Cloacimonetes bacterium]|nr:DUF4476 domain-containing protein [Candidatus Cloacimonadota bacterium]